MQSECGEDFYFSVELESDLAQWERAFQTATFLEVERIQVRTCVCGAWEDLTTHLSSQTTWAQFCEVAPISNVSNV